MKMYIVAVRDITANVYAQPNFVSSVGAAIRSFGDECLRQDPNNIMARHPQDFELYELGTYDDATGKFEELPTPKQIAVGSNYRNK